VRRLVLKAGKPVHMTPKEFCLLHYMMLHAGTSLTHSSLLRAVWGPDRADEVTYLRTFMRQLRMKVDDGGNPRYILTDSYFGYRFVNASDALAGNDTAGRDQSARRIDPGVDLGHKTT
jgi:two-component system KDP operon response regulator KdpE